MTIDTDGITAEMMIDHLQLIRELQRHVPSNPVRFILRDGTSVEGFLSHIGGNYLEVEPLPDQTRGEPFDEIVRIEYESVTANVTI